MNIKKRICIDKLMGTAVDIIFIPPDGDNWFTYRVCLPGLSHYIDTTVKSFADAKQVAKDLYLEAMKRSLSRGWQTLSKEVVQKMSLTEVADNITSLQRRTANVFKQLVAEKVSEHVFNRLERKKLELELVLMTTSQAMERRNKAQNEFEKLVAENNRFPQSMRSPINSLLVKQAALSIMQRKRDLKL